MHIDYKTDLHTVFDYVYEFLQACETPIVFDAIDHAQRVCKSYILQICTNKTSQTLQTIWDRELQTNAKKEKSSYCVR